MNGGAYIQGLAYKWNRKSALKEAMLSSADQNIMFLLWVQRRASQLTQQGSTSLRVILTRLPLQKMKMN